MPGRIAFENHQLNIQGCYITFLDNFLNKNIFITYELINQPLIIFVFISSKYFNIETWGFEWKAGNTVIRR